MQNNTLAYKGALLYRGKPCMCALRGRQPGHLEVRAVLRHFVPYKGLHPLRCLRSYPGALCNENNLLTQTVPAAKSGNPIPPARPSTENVGGLFHPIHPIKKEVMHYDKTENRPRTESRARRQ